MEKCCFKANVVFFISHLYRKKWKNMVYFFHRVTTKILTNRTNILLQFVGHVHQNYLSFQDFNRYRRKRPKVDASIFDSALSHSCRSDSSEKIEKIACLLLDVFACGQVSSPRLYRLKSNEF